MARNIMISALLALLCWTAGMAGAAEKTVIAYSNIADSDVFCLKIKEQFAKFAAEVPNVEVLFTDALLDNMKQIDQVDNFIVQGVDGIVLVPVDFAGITPAVEKANDAGIPVVCLVIASEGGEYTYVGSPNLEAGKLQGDFMRENLPPNAKILYLQGTLGLNHTHQRWDGFKAACLDQRPDIELLSAQSGNFERDQGMKITEDWIQSFPHFDAIVSANDQMALGAIQALTVAGRLDGVLITGVDGVDDAMEHVKEGKMSQTILYNAPDVAKTGFDVIMKRIAGEELPQEVFVPFVSVTKENVDQYMNK
ncbi:MAG: sugar ABC transporter substrate-binding protein [Planctomycetes bacterium]|nr:sugar ABC transporter substrate-binding protein [Planctomycetota bacterium]